MLHFFIAQTAVGNTLALWLFDDPIGSKAAIDSSGNGRHLEIGDAAAIVRGGRFGNALDADAAEIDAPAAYRNRVDDALNLGDSDWTIECWLKAKPNIPGGGRIWGLSGVNYIDYGRPDEPIALEVVKHFLPVNQWDWPTTNINKDQEFHHIAVVNDAKASELRHYFDGKLKHKEAARWQAIDVSEKNPAAFPPHYPQLQIGWRDSIQQRGEAELHGKYEDVKRLRGYIDEMRISDEAIYNNDFTPTSLAIPYLRVWPQELSFVTLKSANNGRASVEPQQLTVSTGGNVLPWTVSSDAEWLTLQPERPDDNGAVNVIVRVDATRLPDGRHEAAVIAKLAAAKQEVVIPVKVSILSSASLRDVSDRKQLFIDKRFIEQSTAVELRQHQAQKVPFEFEPGVDFPLYPCSLAKLDDGKTFRMYYGTWENRSLRYAESTDGLHWKRHSKENFVTYLGPDGKNHHFVLGSTVFRDDHDVPERRYKGFQDLKFPDAPEQNGLYAYVSPDGLHFQQVDRVLPFMCETESLVTAFWDEPAQAYSAYVRVMNSKKGITSIQGSQIFKRLQGAAEAINSQTVIVPGLENVRCTGLVRTNDLLKPWPYNDAAPPTHYSTAAHIKPVLYADEFDPFTDFYNNAAYLYPHAQDVYLAFPAVFRHLHPSRQPRFHMFSDANGPTEIQLATSRDGVNWDRGERTAYVSLGTAEEPDRALQMMGTGMIQLGDWLYQYYFFSGMFHDSAPIRQDIAPVPRPNGGLNAVRQRLDGFVSARAGYMGGALTTPLIVFRGNRLELNHNCNATGSIFVELRDANDVPIPGFTLADCDEVMANDTAWTVHWRGSSDVSKLAGRPIKLHFRMRSADLYAFQFAGEAAE